MGDLGEALGLQLLQALAYLHDRGHQSRGGGGGRKKREVRLSGEGGRPAGQPVPPGRAAGGEAAGAGEAGALEAVRASNAPPRAPMSAAPLARARFAPESRVSR